MTGDKEQTALFDLGIFKFVLEILFNCLNGDK